MIYYCVIPLDLGEAFTWRIPRTEEPGGLLSMGSQELDTIRLRATPQTPAHQAPQSLGFSRQEYWNGPSQERTGESGAFGMWHHPRGSS